MEVYLEVTYLINALTILLTFELLCFLLNLKMSKKELIKYMLTYNISILFLYIDFFDGFLLLYQFLLTVYYFRRLTYIYYPLTLFIYISIISFLEFVLPSSTIFQGVLIIDGIHSVSLLLLSCMVICILYLYISFCQHKLKDNEWVNVSFSDKKCLGFIDNGNKVFYKGYPVIFISGKLIHDYAVIDKIDIETASQKETIDLTVFEEIEINYQKLNHVYVGIIHSNEYDCILNSQLLGGLL
ncbi:MAG: hypothetical protein RR630_07830 [Coprobacillus sp.]